MVKGAPRAGAMGYAKVFTFTVKIQLNFGMWLKNGKCHKAKDGVRRSLEFVSQME
jgi:hypothetical protein